MKLIYISGKYTGKTHDEVELNIRRAGEAGRRIIDLFHKRYYPVIPHNNTAHFEDYTYESSPDYEYFMEGAIGLLETCHAIYMLRGWRESKGAMREYNRAVELGLEIFYE